MPMLVPRYLKGLLSFFSLFIFIYLASVTMALEALCDAVKPAK